MLYIVATPLGNLEDITYRAVRMLREAPLIIAENPLHTQTLLRKYEVKGKKIIQFADHNELAMLDSVIEKLKTTDACLVSDAGTPAISDPGFRLVRACWENNIPVTPIPGPSAQAALLSAGGLPTDKFLFVGFLPKTEPKLYKLVDDAKSTEATLVAYESPQRIVKTLERLEKHAPECYVAVGREITKLHEELMQGSISEVVTALKKKPSIKGEITLLLSFKK